MLLKEFRAWIEAIPPGEDVGDPSDPIACPLSKYFEAKHGHPHQVFLDLARPNSPAFRVDGPHEGDIDLSEEVRDLQRGMIAAAVSANVLGDQPTDELSINREMVLEILDEMGWCA